MSLINEALKKAQKQRTGEEAPIAAMPSIGGETAERIARRGKQPGFNTLFLWIGAGLAGVVIIVAGTVVVVKSMGDKPAATARPAPAATVAATPAAPAPTATAAPAKPAEPPARTEPAAPAPLVVPSSAPAVTKAEPAPAPATPATTVVILPPPAPTQPAPTPAPLVVATTAPANPAPAANPATIRLEPAPAAPAPTRPAGPARIDAKGINFIDSIRVSGIRVSASDSKVLMNDRVYRIGDTVEHELAIRLVGITGTSLTFEDDHGARYTRNF